MRSRVKAGAGVDPMDTQSWVAAGDWAHSRTYHQLSLLPGLPADFLPVVERAAWHEFREALAATPQSLRLGVGPLVDRLVGMTEFAASGRRPATFDVRTSIDLYAEERARRKEAELCARARAAAAAGDTAAAEAVAAETAAIAAKKAAAADTSRALRVGEAANQDPFSPHARFSPVSEQPPKLVVYSGHDTTIAPLAAVLGIPLRSWPPFSTHVELELWRHRDAAATDPQYAYNKLESIVNHARRYAHDLRHRNMV